MDITLYHYWRSSASWRVRYALAVKQIPFKPVAINLLEGAEKSPEYVKLNPSGYVPCLVVDGKIALGESLAIIEWLEENFPKPALLPGDSLQRARIRQFAESINSGIQPLQNLDVCRRFSDDKDEQKAWTQHWVRRGLAVCENFLKEHRPKGATYCFGKEPTLADACLFPQLYSAARNDVDLKAYPILNSINDFAKGTPEFQASHPDAYAPENK